jgi:hypothetical protein
MSRFVPHRPKSLYCALALAAAVGLVPLLAGCNLLGVAAYAMPRPVVEPQYTDLAGRSVAVMVWADRAIRIDWQPLQLDLANAIQKKLADMTATDKVEVVKGTTYPIKPESIVRYQRDYPDTEGMPITELAPVFKVQRLIYVEIEEFGTRVPGSSEMFRGRALATLRIVEIADGKAKVAYEEPAVEAIFPEKGPQEGTPNADDFRIYRGTVDGLSTQIVHRVTPYRPEE